MLMYHAAHPLTKLANAQSIFSAVRQYGGNALNWAAGKLPDKKTMFGLAAGGALGIGVGGYLGNNMYKSQIPPVKALPRMDQAPYVFTPESSLQGQQQNLQQNYW